MGQYYYVINIDKKEYLHPHRFDDGLKFREFYDTGDYVSATMKAANELVAPEGRWHGDTVVIAGDEGTNVVWRGEADDADLRDIHQQADEEAWANISKECGGRF